ncbi:hypothetical protein RND81_14G233600, partial [Saponaria officinalis]
DDDHTSQGTPNFDLNLNSQKTNENRVWSEKEDETLMLAWCLVSNDSIVGKNQNNYTRWNKVFDLYEQTRVENQNQNQLRVRSIDAMKSRFQRLNYVVNKWVGCYNQVINRPPASGTNITDDIKSAQQLFANSNGGVEFNDFNVYNNVMSKHEKRSLQNTQFGVSGNISGSKAAKKKRKEKTPTSESMFSDQDVSLLEGHRIATETQVQQRERRIEADLKIEELRLLKIKTKMEMTMLNTLFSRQDLNVKDQEMKENDRWKLNMAVGKSEMDEQSVQLQSLIAERMNQYISTNTQQPIRTPRRRKRYIERNREEGHTHKYATTNPFVYHRH